MARRTRLESPQALGIPARIAKTTNSTSVVGGYCGRGRATPEYSQSIARFHSHRSLGEALPCEPLGKLAGANRPEERSVNNPGYGTRHRVPSQSHT